jgi:hypothetical protein
LCKHASGLLTKAKALAFSISAAEALTLARLAQLMRAAFSPRAHIPTDKPPEAEPIKADPIGGVLTSEAAGLMRADKSPKATC